MKSKSFILLVIGVIVALFICGTQFTNVSKKINKVATHHKTIKHDVKPAYKIYPKESIQKRLKVFI